MKLIIFFALLLSAQLSIAQIKVVKLDKSAVPHSVKYLGKIINAVKYTDVEGEHLVITTETGEQRSKDSEDDTYRDAALYAYCFNIKNGTPLLYWQVRDFVKECPVDIKANFVPNTFAVTDLNKDNKAEVWLMYKTVCHGDVSPSNMKIIMYEGNKKYAVRGTTKVKISDKDYGGGEYTFDNAFTSGPQPFRDYALQLWKKNLMETW